jgi:hypothetical protein
VKRLVSILLGVLLAVGTCAISGAAVDGGYTWPLGQALPHFSTPAATLDAFSVEGRPFAERLTASALQGLVNRSEPRIFQLDGREGTGSPNQWAADLGLTLNVLSGYLEAVEKYAGCVEGLIIWNTAIPETANVATTAAGILNALPATPAQADILTAAPYNFPVLKDFRDETAITDKYSAYQYLYDNYWQDCTKRTLCGLIPDNHTQLRDFAVAVRAAVFWLDAADEQDAAMLRLFFDDSAPIDTYYTGWWPNEPAGVALASQYGVMTIASDFFENYTVWSGYRENIEQPAVPATPKLENNKIYVSLNISDGDNIQYDQHYLRSTNLWLHPRRGEIPIGWTFSPLLLDAAPSIMNYYYTTATENDVLICGPSGAGYSTVQHWSSNSIIDKYAAITNDYFERSGINIVTLWTWATPLKVSRFAAGIPSLLGMTSQFETGPLQRRFVNGNTPIMWFGSDNLASFGSMSYDTGNANMLKRLSAAAERTVLFDRPQFFMAQGNVWECNINDFLDLRDQLEALYPDRFVFVRPDHLFELMEESLGKPHNVARNGTSDTPEVFDGSFATGLEGNQFTVDLGGEFLLNRYVVKNRGAYEAGAGNTAAWRLQYSTDGTNWKNADIVSGNEAAFVYRSLCNERARYVRLIAENPSPAVIKDIEIYATPTGTGEAFWNSFCGFFYDIWNWLNNTWHSIGELFSYNWLG